MRPFNQPQESTLVPLKLTYSTALALEYTGGRSRTLSPKTRRAMQALWATSPRHIAERPFRVMHQRRRLQVCRRTLYLWRLKPRTMAILRDATQHVVWTGGRS